MITNSDSLAVLFIENKLKWEDKHFIYLIEENLVQVMIGMFCSKIKCQVQLPRLSDIK